MLDARRDEVYSAVYDFNYNLIQKEKPEIINEDSFKEILSSFKLYFTGSGQEKCERLIKKNLNLNFSNNDNFPSSKEMGNLSYEKFINSNFEDLAYFEPAYLKNFSLNK